MKKYLNSLRTNWNRFAEEDPLWAILVDPEKKGGKWNERDFFKTGVDEINQLLNSLKINEITFHTGKALDFGCGVGRLTQGLAEHFESVVGVDISHKMVQLAASYNSKKNCTYKINEEVEFRDFAPDSFDLIYSNIVLQHNKPEAVFCYLSEFMRILKKDGLLIFQMPDRMVNPFNDILRNNIISQRLLYKLYLFIKFGSYPQMEMYSIRKENIIKHFESLGAEVVLIQTNGNSGPRWISHSYYLRKR